MALHIADNARPMMAQELLDAILDHLHYDTKTLKRCALVCKSFLPTSQRHLFSTYQVSKSNMEKLMEFFTPLSSTDSDDDGNGSLRAGVADLLNAYTTDLILSMPDDDETGFPDLPEFKNVRRVVFKGNALGDDLEVPPFLLGTWTSPTSKILTVEFVFRLMSGKAVLQLLYTLPAMVENVSFTSKGARHHYTSVAIFRDGRVPPDPDRAVRHLNGTVKLHLGTDQSHDPLLEAMVELGDFFKFDLKRISYGLSCHIDVPHLASLVDGCKNTLEYLDITCSSRFRYSHKEVQSFNFSRHRALRIIRIWTPASFHPGWIRTAISSIPKPSSANPRAPSLRIELHISLPPWMMYQNEPWIDAPSELDRIVNSWIPVDAQLSHLMGLGADAPGITSDVSVPYLSTGPGSGIASLMFPLLSGTKGLLRLV